MKSPLECGDFLHNYELCDVRGVRTVARKILQLKASSRKGKKKIPGKFSSKLFPEEGGRSGEKSSNKNRKLTLSWKEIYLAEQQSLRLGAVSDWKKFYHFSIFHCFAC